MRMRQLATESGLPTATIKFYLREGLLHEGVRGAPNQAVYDHTHLRRIALIRALTVTGGLSLSAAKRVIDAANSDLSLPDVFEVAQRSLTADNDLPLPSKAAFRTVDALFDGWHFRDDNPGRIEAARVIDVLGAVGQEYTRDWLEAYARAALGAAEADLRELDHVPGREAKAATVVVGTVLGDRLFAAIRRVAQEHVTNRS